MRARHYAIYVRASAKGRLRVIVAKTEDELGAWIKELEGRGCLVESVFPFDPVPVDERFYA